MDRVDHMRYVEQQKAIINKYFTTVSCERIFPEHIATHIPYL